MADATSDIFIQDLEAEFGDTGYAFWFKTLELIASQGDGGVLDISENAWRRVIYSKRTDHLRRLYTFCTERDKFQVETLPNGLLRIICKNFAKYADNYTKYGKELQSNFEESLKNVNANRIEEKRTEEKNIYIQRFTFLWGQYPKPVGKKNAERHFLASVKTENDWADIQGALLKYKVSGNVQAGYIQNGSTWFNNWRDWIEPTEQMMKGNNGTQGRNNKNDGRSDQTKRATFEHKPEDVERFRTLQETLRADSERRAKRSGLDPKPDSK